MNHTKKPKIYLAGPDVFIQQSDIGERKKRICRKYDFIPLYPLDNEIADDCELAGNNKFASNSLATKIFESNCQMIDECDIVLANISPFRGPHCDPGTAFEIGYGLAKQKRVITYSNDERTLIKRIQEDHPNLISDRISIENFNLIENLMISAKNRTKEFAVNDRNDLSAWQAFIQSVKFIAHNSKPE